MTNLTLLSKCTEKGGSRTVDSCFPLWAGLQAQMSRKVFAFSKTDLATIVSSCSGHVFGGCQLFRMCIVLTGRQDTPFGLYCSFWASVFQRFKSAVCWTPTIDFFTRNTMSFQWLWIAYSELYPPTAHYCLYFSSILQFPLSANMKTQDHKRLRGSLGTVEMQ